MPLLDFSQPAPFFEILMKKFDVLLKERDTSTHDVEMWAVNVALDAEQLQNNYTLVGAISYKLESVIAHILVYVITRVDHNENLSLLNPKWAGVFHFWLRAFENADVLCLQYAESTMQQQPIQAETQGFRCKFPFSREFINQIETVYHEIVQRDTGLFIGLHLKYFLLMMTMMHLFFF